MFARLNCAVNNSEDDEDSSDDGTQVDHKSGERFVFFCDDHRHWGEVVRDRHHNLPFVSYFFVLGEGITVAFKCFWHTFSFVDKSVGNNDRKFKVVIMLWLGVE